MTFPQRFSLSGKTVAFTGGLGLLGGPLVEACLDAGAEVAFADLDATACASRATELQDQYGRKVTGIGCDIGDPGEARDFIAEAHRQHGRLDVLVNAAATKGSNLAAFFEPSETFLEETWNEVTRTNLSGMFWVAREAGRVMKEQGHGGSIIQVSSIYGITAPDNRIYEGSQYLGMSISTPAVYAATKGGVVALTRFLATELAAFGIRVNTLVPGGVESGQNTTFSSKYSARVPLGRMAQISDMVGPLIFLASEASGYMTGQELIIDGGLTAW